MYLPLFSLSYLPYIIREDTVKVLYLLLANLTILSVTQPLQRLVIG
jgi:hypothetical protein